jgi:hypothetical protein
MALLDDALGASGCVISVMGAHAGEDADTIFRRKIEDCETVGRTFWVAKSAKARPTQVQTVCRSGKGFVIFVEPASPRGARPTTGSDFATEYSPDKVEWFPLPEGLGPVTGQIDDFAAALVLDRFTSDVDHRVDLWTYADGANPDKPLKFILGLSTACALRKDTSEHPERMKSRYRRVVAVARLAEPYCVWLR